MRLFILYFAFACLACSKPTAFDAETRRLARSIVEERAKELAMVQRDAYASMLKRNYGRNVHSSVYDSLYSKIDTISDAVQSFSALLRSANRSNPNVQREYIRTIRLLTTISIADTKLSHLDYSTKDGGLDTLMMTNEINKLAIMAIRNIASKMGTSIHDDFSQPYATGIFSERNSHTFSVHYGVLQSYPSVSLAITEVHCNGKPIDITPIIDNTDVVGIVRFTKLAKGSYFVSGRVKAPTTKVDERRFTYRFEIR